MGLGIGVNEEWLILGGETLLRWLGLREWQTCAGRNTPLRFARWGGSRVEGRTSAGSPERDGMGQVGRDGLKLVWRAEEADAGQLGGGGCGGARRQKLAWSVEAAGGMLGAETGWG